LLARKQTLAQIDADIQAILNSKSASYFLKFSLGVALKKDPVDAANDAAELARLLSLRRKAKEAQTLRS
jgi:hypothetical protein